MALYKRLLFVLTLLVLVLASCTKPVLIGSDFLEDEKASLKFKDDFSLSFFTEKTDSVLVHGADVTSQLYTYLLGELDDPFFGKAIAEIYAQPILPTVGTELLGATLDSVVLELRYDTLGNYGTIAAPVTIEVHRMTQRPDFKTDYYSNESFTYSSEVLGSLTFTPRPKDSVTVIRSMDTVKMAPHIRIPLNTLLFSDITSQDTIVYQHLDSFLTYFNGLYIKMTNAGNTMLGLNLVNSVSGLSVFYKPKDTEEHKEFKFVFTGASVKAVHFENDYSGSPVQAALAPEPESDYWYVQGMSGVRTKMVVDGLSDLGTAIINEADLEIYCSFPDGDDPFLYPVLPFIVTQISTDTSIANSLDVNIALSRASGNYYSTTYEAIYGGVARKAADGPPAIYKYEMKVTSQIKDIFAGKKENIIYFNPIDKGNQPGRSIIFGPGNPLYAPRLKVYYTAL
ncbi:MAG: DUF4270 family protein [Saprospiraceae bacterium]